MTFINAKSVRIFQAKECDENRLLVYVNNKKGVKKENFLRFGALGNPADFVCKKKTRFCRLFFGSSKSLHDMYLEVLSGRRGAKTSPIK